MCAVVLLVQLLFALSAIICGAVLMTDPFFRLQPVVAAMQAVEVWGRRSV